MVTEEQKALIRQIVYEVSDVVIERHVKACPTADKLRRGMYFAIGVAVGSGGLSLAAIIKLIGG